MSRATRFRETVERVTGVALRPLSEVNQLQESELEMRGKLREIADAGYEVFGYVEGTPQDMKAQERRKLAQQARLIWQSDPQYGGTVNLLNEFVLGRGIPKPQAVDEEAQRHVDRFWLDPDNRRVLTTHEAQLRFNTDLSIQSNVFPLVYDEGDDAMVKLGLLDHDTVTQAVRDPDKRLAVLYYFTKSRKRTWDPQKHSYVVEREPNHLRYYEEFRNLQDALRDKDQGLRKEELPNIPDDMIGRGRVLHVAINRTLEQAFGVPEIARTVRWLTAYNDLMRARVDMAKAAASIIMRRKLKGGAAAMQQLLSQTLLTSGASATAPPDPAAMAQAPKPGAVIEENDWVEHQPFSLNSGSQGAEQDARMIRAQYSVGTGWPGTYLGDAQGANLSTSTSLELRVLKMVETRQQVLQDLIATLVQHVLRKAVEKGKLSRWRPMTAEERKREEKRQQEEAQAASTGEPQPVGLMEAEPTATVGPTPDEHPEDVFAVELEDPNEAAPEGYVARELEFQVSMPSPLRRAMGDLITAIANIAKTFDPNNTNQELTKLLLGIALGEGLEVEDPGAAVERCFPEGYVDPAVAAALAQAAPSLPPDAFTPEQSAGPVGQDGQRHPNPDNPYSAPQQAQPPELVMQQAAQDRAGDERLMQLYSRSGEAMPRQVQEAIVRRAAERLVGRNHRSGELSAAAIGAARGERSDVEADRILGPALKDALANLA